mmetsp:Transcript_59041/g.164968  ORF Transcript_59041/g.164968 Transcript_59041/m.164968 type:complete len:86 (-) Transcript_59041:12-269(-)
MQNMKGTNWGFFAMLYQTGSIGRIRRTLEEVVWNTSRPTCLVQDIALASLSDQIAYYAVPATQAPGFLTFVGSKDLSREDMNKQT